MTIIPETGPGLSGFLAHYLWQVYVHFPSAGKWDWVLLFLSLGAARQFLFLPYLWNSVKADMMVLKEGRVGSDGPSAKALFWNLGWLSFFIWFFHTSAGHVLLDGRQIFWVKSVTAVDTSFVVFSLSFLCFIFGVILSLTSSLMDKHAEAAGAKKSHPYIERDFTSLYLGGGAFILKNGSVWSSNNIMFFEPIIILTTYLFAGPLTLITWLLTFLFQSATLNIIEFYLASWFWSVASLTLIMCFILAAFLFEGVRMLFVYILHKRTFG